MKKNNNKKSNTGKKTPGKKTTVTKKTNKTATARKTTSQKSAPKKTIPAKSPKAKKPEPRKSSTKPGKTVNQPKKTKSANERIAENQIETIENGKLFFNLYEIKNGQIYKCSGREKEETHLYVGFSNEKQEIVKAVETTHLIEPGKAQKIRDGLLLKIQFGDMENPTGIDKSYYTKNIKNKTIKTSDNYVLGAKGKINKSQAEKIYAFAIQKRR